MADQRILRNRPATLTVMLYDQDGIAADAAGAVTVGVTRADGTVVKAAGTATTHGATGVYTRTLTAAEVGTTVGQLTATWTDAGGGGQLTTIDVVGGYVVSIGDLRAQANLSDAGKFSNEKLIGARKWFEELAERYCNVAFVPRFARERLGGNGTTRLLTREPLPISLLSVRAYSDASTYATFDASDLADVVVDDGYLSRVARGTWAYGSANLVIEYEHGFTSPPADIYEAALEAIRAKVLTDKNDSAGPVLLSVADGAGGITRYAMPGPDRPTGIPKVDEALNAHRFVPVG